MSIEEALTRMAEAQERTATALEAVLAILGAFPSGGVVRAAEDKPADKPASTGSRRQAKNVEREDKPADPPPADDKPADPPAQEVDPLDDDLGLDDPKDEEEEKFTEDQVRVALKNYRAINGSDATMAALKDHGGGATGMGSLKPEFYASVMKVVR